MFKIGQKVVYITGLNLPKDSIWIIKDIIKFECGCMSIDIGLSNYYSKRVMCANHTNIAIVNNSVRYFSSKSFRPLESKSAIKDLCNDFKEIIETSDVPIKELV